MLIVQSRKSCSQKFQICCKLKIHRLKMCEEGKGLCVWLSTGWPVKQPQEKEA